MRRAVNVVGGVLGVVLLCVGAARADITSGLAQHFKLDERSGTVVTDSVGSNDGAAEPTGFSDDQWVWGHIIGALKFNGFSPAADYVTASSAAWMAPGPRTLSVWFRVDAGISNHSTVLLYRNGENKLYFYVNLDTYTLSLRVKQASPSIEYDMTTPFAVSAGEWHNVIMTFGGGTTVAYYYDGKKISDTALAPDPDFSGNPSFNLGAANTPPSTVRLNGFNGLIDDFRVYTRVLTGTVDGGDNLVGGDLYELYTSRKDDMDSGLVQHFMLDETSGTDVTDSAGANDGTIVSERATPLWAWEPDGYVDGALKVDGNAADAEYVDASSAAWMAAGPRTLSMWFKTSETVGANNFLMGFRDADDKLYIYIDTAGSLIARVQEQGGDDYSATGPAVTQDVWHNIILTFGGDTTPAYYYDGTLFSGATTLTPDPNWSGNPDFELGCYDNKINSYRGLIDEFRVYARALAGTVDGGGDLVGGDLYLLYNYTGAVPPLGTVVVVQ